MANSRTRKPLLDWDTERLKKRMREIGYVVEFSRKPETFENLSSKRNQRLAVSIDNLSDESRDEILEYLDEIEADGGLVIDMQIWDGDFGINYGNLTVVPFKLKPLRGSKQKGQIRKKK